MEQRAQELRQAIEQSRGGQARWRCPAALREEVVAFAKERRKAGGVLEAIADELGVSSSALQRWIVSDRDRAGQPEALRKVRVVEPRSSVRSLTVVTPQGYRIEGLDIGSAVRVLQALQ